VKAQTNPGINTGINAGTANVSASAIDAAHALKAAGSAAPGQVKVTDLKDFAAKTAQANARTGAQAGASPTPSTRPAAEAAPTLESSALTAPNKQGGAAAASPNSAAKTISAGTTPTTSATAASKAATAGSASASAPVSPAGDVSASASATPSAATAAVAEPTLESARIDTALDSAKLASDGSKLDAANALRAPERAGAASRGQAPDLAAFAMRFAKQTANGARRFEIRLDPAELGRVDVRIEVSEDGVTRARMMVERPEALAELIRHARSLERELADAGLDLADGGLKFELAEDARGDDGQNGDAPVSDDAQAPQTPPPAASSLEPEALAEIDTEYGFSVMRRGRMDVRV